MLDGWALQQRVRFLKADTIQRRLKLIRRVVDASDRYPWQWQATDVERFIDALRTSDQPIAYSTARGYLAQLELFVEYVTDGRYGWPATCPYPPRSARCRERAGKAWLVGSTSGNGWWFAAKRGQ